MLCVIWQLTQQTIHIHLMREVMDDLFLDELYNRYQYITKIENNLRDNKNMRVGEYTAAHPSMHTDKHDKSLEFENMREKQNSCPLPCCPSTQNRFNKHKKIVNIGSSN